jgi:hypothetical protein
VIYCTCFVFYSSDFPVFTCFQLLFQFWPLVLPSFVSSWICPKNFNSCQSVGIRNSFTVAVLFFYDALILYVFRLVCRYSLLPFCFWVVLWKQYNSISQICVTWQHDSPVKSYLQVLRCRHTEWRLWTKNYGKLYLSNAYINPPPPQVHLSDFTLH